ncbi:MAG: hypothetical protein QXW79_01600 [Thermoplasmata archaeon]
MDKIEERRTKRSETLSEKRSRAGRLGGLASARVRRTKKRSQSKRYGSKTARSQSGGKGFGSAHKTRGMRDMSRMMDEPDMDDVIVDDQYGGKQRGLSRGRKTTKKKSTHKTTTGTRKKKSSTTRTGSKSSRR